LGVEAEGGSGDGVEDVELVFVGHLGGEEDWAEARGAGVVYGNAAPDVGLVGGADSTEVAVRAGEQDVVGGTVRGWEGEGGWLGLLEEAEGAMGVGTVEVELDFSFVGLEVDAEAEGGEGVVEDFHRVGAGGWEGVGGLVRALENGDGRVVDKCGVANIGGGWLGEGVDGGGLVELVGEYVTLSEDRDGSGKGGFVDGNEQDVRPRVALEHAQREEGEEGGVGVGEDGKGKGLADNGLEVFGNGEAVKEVLVVGGRKVGGGIIGVGAVLGMVEVEVGGDIWEVGEGAEEELALGFVEGRGEVKEGVGAGAVFGFGDGGGGLGDVGGEISGAEGESTEDMGRGASLEGVGDGRSGKLVVGFGDGVGDGDAAHGVDVVGGGGGLGNQGEAGEEPGSGLLGEDSGFGGERVVKGGHSGGEEREDLGWFPVRANGFVWVDLGEEEVEFGGGRNGKGGVKVVGRLDGGGGLCLLVDVVVGDKGGVLVVGNGVASIFGVVVAEDGAGAVCRFKDVDVVFVRHGGRLWAVGFEAL
jgi:hypothetical protein